MAKKKLGEMLIEKGLINNEQLHGAIDRQRQWGGRVGANLVKLGHLSEVTLLKFLSEQMNLPCADLTKISFKPEVLSLITVEVAKKHNIIPVEAKSDATRKVLFIATSEPTNITAIDEVSFITGYSVRPVIATDSQIESAIKKYYDFENWAEVPALKEKVNAIGSIEIERLHATAVAEPPPNKKEKEAVYNKNPELLALIRILVKKGLITKDDYVQELKNLKEMK